jgi:predicted N-acyltransferase
MGDSEKAVISVRPAMSEFDAAEWDACAGPDNPFLRHAFLEALEESGSARPETGWAPHHLALEDDSGTLLGAVPMYLKSQSQGEYVFDHQWAAAYERAGGDYYPKLLAAVPFTPVTGRRLLARPGPMADAVRGHLLDGAAEVARRLGVSSANINFLTEAEWKLAGSRGWLQRMDQQFHWENRGYGSFDDFLDDLSSRKRKTLRRERREALENGIEVEFVTGSDLAERHWDAFWEFYQDTGSRKWGRPYLTRRFFSMLGERMAEAVVLIFAKREGHYVAGALNLKGTDALYGRYWGCVEEHPFLHFEICYYQAIDYAIAAGLKRVEAGAQGGHKLARGYVPTPTYSAHWIIDPSFRKAVEHYLESERRYVAEEIDELGDYAPFRKGE